MLNATMGHSGTQSAAEAFCTVNAHCLENIVRLSDDMDVLASHDIVDDRGIKLWAKGKPVSRALQEKMLKRRLQKPLEISLDVGDGVSLESIVDDCFTLMKEVPALELLGGSSSAKATLKNARSIQLPAPLKLLLISARERMYLPPNSVNASMSMRHSVAGAFLSRVGARPSVLENRYIRPPQLS